MAAKRRKRRETAQTTQRNAISALVRRWRLRCITKAYSATRALRRCFDLGDADFEEAVCYVCCVCLLLLMVTLIAALIHSHNAFPSDSEGLLQPTELQTPANKPFNSSTATSILDALCSEWRAERYAGDYCEALCGHSVGAPRNWTLADYTRGGNKHVLKLRIGEQSAVLKMQFPYANEYDQQIDFGQVDEAQFTDKLLDLVNDHLRLDWPRRYKGHLLRRIWPPFAAGGDNGEGRRRWLALGVAEKRSLWALLQQDEFINSALLQMSRVTPKLLGVCGHAYLVEYLVPFRMKPYYLSLKAKILVHLMGTLKLFNEFLNEPLQWCDVKFDNMGLSANYPKRFVMMDNDLLFTESRLNAMFQSQRCSNDTECGLFDCASQCNATTGHCTARTNDNIDVFCKKLVIGQLFGNFWSKSNNYLANCHGNSTPVERLRSLQLTWAWNLADV